MTDIERDAGHERKGSLRSRMLWRVLVPLALTWLVGSAVASIVAFFFTRAAFDRSLVDNAYAIAANVVERDGDLSLSLTPPALRGILFDRSDTLYYAILRQDGSLVAGTPGLRPGIPPAGASAEVRDSSYAGASLRMATVRREDPRPFVVVVAQTTVGRGELLKQLLVYSVAPQAVLLLIIGTWLRRSIGRELEPLGRLQKALQQRDSTDLTPVHVAAESRDAIQCSGDEPSAEGRSARQPLFAHDGEGANAGDALFSPGYVSGSRRECRVNFTGDPAALERGQHTAAAFDFIPLTR